jgi:hypothetical protein
MAPNLKEILATKHGRDVIVYLMVPRSTIWFYPGTLDILKQGMYRHDLNTGQICLKRGHIFKICKQILYVVCCWRSHLSLVSSNNSYFKQIS